MNNKLMMLLSRNYYTLHPELQKQIYMEYYHTFYGVVLYIVKDHASVEDIIQESFMKVISKLPPNITETKQLLNWIRVVIRHVSYDYLRKNKKDRNETYSDHVLINENIEADREYGYPENETEHQLMVESIHRYLEALQPRYQALLLLRWKKGLTYREIANYLNIKESTVKTQLHRAREAIKKRFNKEWGEKR